MYVKDYMATELITIPPTISITEAQELLRKHDINRLPVLLNDKLVGLVTKDIIDRNLPSNATSLSKNEMNYILSKMTVQDIMAKKIETVGPDTLLDQAAQTMAAKNLSVLVVLENNDIVGLITYKDIFKAFIDISGTNVAGTTLIVELSVDRPGVIEEIGDALVESENNLTHMMVYYHHANGGIRIVIHVNTDRVDQLVQAIESRGYEVKSRFTKSV